MDTDAFLNALRSKAAAAEPDLLLKKMGYAKPGPATHERLSHVLADPDLGRKQGGYDFRYDSKAFLVALCLAVGITDKDAQAATAAITARLEEDAAAFKPYLFVDTEFRLRNEQIFVMALLESERYVSFPPGFSRLPHEQQLARVSEQVRQHMAETGGKLALWGDIKRYLYFFAKGKAIDVAVDGRVLGERDSAVPSHAYLEKGLEKLLIPKGSHVRSDR